MESIEVKKELLKNKTVAKLSHYCAGNLYYQVELESGLYQFPIATTSEDTDATARLGRSLLYLSEDLGTTSFDSEIKASFLNRWIDKAIKSSEFIKVN
jgi:hypothetical protein